MGNATVDERLLARLAEALAPRDEILEAYLLRKALATLRRHTNA